jgi:hypothetical protein
MSSPRVGGMRRGGGSSFPMKPTHRCVVELMKSVGSLPPAHARCLITAPVRGTVEAVRSGVARGSRGGEGPWPESGVRAQPPPVRTCAGGGSINVGTP